MPTKSTNQMLCWKGGMPCPKQNGNDCTRNMNFPDKCFVYQSILKRLSSNNLPNPPEKYIKMPEVHHLYGETTNNEIIEKILTAIASNLNKYPKNNVNKFVKEFAEKLKKTESRLQQYKELSPEEQMRKTHQL